MFWNKNRFYSYFVSYNHPKGFGMINICLDHKIKSYKDIINIKEFIDKNCIEDIIIINYQLLKE